MRVDWLSLSQFRSYQSLEWAPDPGVNVLVGRNATGKTNVLEAIGYLAGLKSFRSVPDSELIADDAGAAVIRAGVSGEDRERLIEIQLNRSGPRQVQVDKNRLRRSTEMLGVLRVVAFLSDDLDLVKRGPSYRRDLLDEIAVQFWPAAHLDQAEFERSLRQRNAFLKSGDRDQTTLSVWDSRLAQAGGRVLARRAKATGLLAPLLAVAYGEISSDGLEAALGYRATWGDGTLGNRTAGDYADDLAQALEASRQADLDRRLTTVGPHRDEPGFRLNHSEARTHASQGEQRSIALAVKIASHRAIGDLYGESPILLLDDVFSELDAGRSEALAASLPEDTQTIITSARPEDVPLTGLQWTVGDGISR